MNLTEHFTLAELLHSDTALRRGMPNVPNDAHVLGNLHVLARGLERVRRAIGGYPIHVNSGYRSPDVNAYIGGAPNSAHMRGLAADIVVPGLTAWQVAHLIVDHADMVGFDVVIHEGTWTHVQFADSSDEPAGKVLTAHFSPGKAATYTKGLS